LPLQQTDLAIFKKQGTDPHLAEDHVGTLEDGGEGGERRWWKKGKSLGEPAALSICDVAIFDARAVGVSMNFAISRLLSATGPLSST
jgi:hypothetical protein